MLALPAAFLLSFALYMLLPSAETAIFRFLRSAYHRFETRAGQHALPLFLCLLGLLASALGALHPVIAALVMTPLFTAPAVLPACAKVKDELDSGKYVRDIPAYEDLVRKTCQSLAPAFLTGAAAPLIVCAVGFPLYIGCGLGWVYLSLRLFHPQSHGAQCVLVLVLRLSDKVFSFMLLLCAGVVGRSPFSSRGRDAKSHLLSILGIAEDGANTHAPMAGDIAQGIFLCCFCMALLCLSLTAVGFALC